MNNFETMTLNNTTLTKENVEIEKVIPTTPSQMEIWLACKLGGKEANMAYNESVSIQLTGELSVKSLQEAFLRIIQRHDGMRAIISPNGKHLMVMSSYELPIRLRDISEMNLADKEKFLKKHSQETGTYQFNLTQGPLYVMELIKLDSLHHQLTFTGHHLIFDGWSLGVMLEELGSLYTSILKGTESNLESPDDLSEYSVELINYTRKASYKDTKRFWVKYLSEPVPKLSLPLDKVRPRIRTYPCGVIEVPYEEKILAKTRELSGKSKVSLNHTLLSVFEIFLSDWTRQKDIVVGLPVAGQLLSNRPSLIGHCVHLLPLRSRIDTSQTFSEYLQLRRKSYNETLDHQEISFGSMIQDLKIPRDPSRIPLVPLTFNIDMGMDSMVSFAGLEHKLISNPKAYANFEIIVNLSGSVNGNIFEWTYNKDLFEESSIVEAANRYLACLEQVLENPDIKIADLLISESSADLPQDSENTDLLSVDTTEFVPVSTLSLSNFEKLGDQLALNFQNETFSYQTVGNKVKSFAGYLIQKGVGPGDIVGVNMDRTPEMIFTLLGIFQAGAAYLPIDLDFPEERVKFMLKDAGVKFFLSDRTGADWGELASKKLELAPEVFSDFIGEFLPIAPSAEDPVFVIYTSGSTGVPKGVVLSQNNVCQFSKNCANRPGYENGDRILGITSISFDMHWLELVMPFAYGVSLFLLSKYHRIDSREALKAIEKHRITILSATPSFLRSLVSFGMTKRLEGLRITSAGEPMPLGLAHALTSVCDTLYNNYGPSETSMFSTLKKIEPGCQLITIGKPLPGTSVVIVDDDGNLIRGSGKVGEILIGGTGVCLGYLNRPELNQEKFINAPWPAVHDRYYRSGDLGHWTEDGEIICQGRVDHQVKIRGQRVELGEIESKIAMDERVQHVAVLKYTEENGDDLLRAFVSINESFKSGLDTQSWIEECRASLSKQVASYMVPAQIVVLDHLPLNSNGKVDRLVIKSYAVDAPIAIPTQKKTVAEGTGSQGKVKFLWEKVLQVENAGPDDDFFEVGGHSLLAVELISLIETELKISLPLSILFEFPTIRSIAAQIDSLSKKDFEPQFGSFVKIKDGDPEKVLFFISGEELDPVETDTLIQHMDDNQTIWGLQPPSIVDDTVAPMSTVEEIAGYYISQIQSAGVRGPYHLIGKSFGGLIAFEMTNQLVKADDRVGFLGVIDTVALQDQGAGIGTFIEKLIFEVKFALRDIRFYLNFKTKNSSEKSGDISGDYSQTNDSSLDSRIKQQEQVNKNAWKNYSHPYINTKITLFLAERETFYVRDAETLGWKAFAREIETIKTPGEHSEMLKPPYGKRFSKALQSKLNAVK